MIDLFGEEVIVRRKKDWSGNKKTAFSIIGASNHSLTDRAENDYYATPPQAVDMLLDMETFSRNIWEPACGQGHISKVLEAHGHDVFSTDLVDRGYGKGGLDFLRCANTDQDTDIITNPPYSKAQEFVEKSLEVVGMGHKVAMFLKLTFLEGKNRRKMFDEHPPRVVYVSSSRLSCGKNGTEWNPSSICYAWFVWVKGIFGNPIIKWFN